MSKTNAKPSALALRLLACVPGSTLAADDVNRYGAMIDAEIRPLVDLLREGLGGWSGPHGLMAWRDKIRAALAKAEGGAR